MWIAPLLLVVGCAEDKKAPAGHAEDSDELCHNGLDDDHDFELDCLDATCAEFCGGDSDADVDTDVDADTDTGSDVPDECDVILQSGCEAGEACKLSWIDGAPSVACLPPGTGLLGETCATSVDCESGLTCWETCRPACHLPADCAAVPAGLFDSSDCLIVQQGWGRCTTPCDPLNAGSCAGGGQCMLLVDGDLPTTDCVVAVGEAVAGDTCTEPLDCSPGTACDDAVGGGFTCETVCDSADDCPGTACRLLTGDLVGTCR
jgi:hypothetical protein